MPEPGRLLRVSLSRDESSPELVEHPQERDCQRCSDCCCDKRCCPTRHSTTAFTRSGTAFANPLACAACDGRPIVASNDSETAAAQRDRSALSEPGGVDASGGRLHDCETLPIRRAEVVGAEDLKPHYCLPFHYVTCPARPGRSLTRSGRARFAGDAAWGPETLRHSTGSLCSLESQRGQLDSLILGDRFGRLVVDRPQPQRLFGAVERVLKFCDADRWLLHPFEADANIVVLHGFSFAGCWVLPAPRPKGLKNLGAGRSRQHARKSGTTSFLHAISTPLRRNIFHFTLAGSTNACARILVPDANPRRSMFAECFSTAACFAAFWTCEAASATCGYFCFTSAWMTG